MRGRIFLGTSGWNYKHWSNGVFYPPGLKPAEWLRFYAEYFDTVEVNYSFYRLPPRSTFDEWRKQSPPGFCYSAKASRFFTHMKKLIDPPVNAARIMENVTGLGEKLGVILFQLPPHWGFNAARLAGLLDYLSTQKYVSGGRFALEVRDPSWYTGEAFRMLERHNVALVLADQPGFAAEGPLTADFVFVRRHGPGSIWGSDYPEEHLRSDARKIDGWVEGERDVFMYFNNDPFGFAVKNAIYLKKLLNL